MIKKELRNYNECFWRNSIEKKAFNYPCGCEKTKFYLFKDLNGGVYEIEVCKDWFVEEVKKRMYMEDHAEYYRDYGNGFNPRWDHERSIINNVICELKLEIIKDITECKPYWLNFIDYKDLTAYNLHKGDSEYRHEDSYQKIDRCNFDYNRKDLSMYMPFDNQYLISAKAIDILGFICNSGIEKANCVFGGYGNTSKVIFKIFDCILRTLENGFVNGKGKIRKSVAKPIMERLINTRLYMPSEIETDCIKFLCEIIERIDKKDLELFYK